MAAKVYPSGIICFPKHEKAPDFVVGDMTISIDDFGKWIKDNPEYITEYKGKRQIKLQITKDQNGLPSVSVNTWKPNQEAVQHKQYPKRQESFNANNDDQNDLPF